MPEQVVNKKGEVLFEDERPGVVKLTGSNAPLKTDAPRLLTTIPFGDFTTPSTNKYVISLASLNRNARHRTFIIANSLNQPLTSLSVFIYESTVGNLSTKTMSVSLSAPVSNAVVIDTSENKPLLAGHVDSVMFGLGIGATLPTSGDVKIYVVELI